MALYSLGEAKPLLGESVYISESADVIGEVIIGDHANIWFGCVLRGDINKIEIGAQTNIQDQSVLHVVKDIPCIVGKQVTVGHKATLHACEIGDNCLIGMDATILDGAKIGAGSVVAAGSVVPPGKTYPPGVLIMGSPAKVVRDLTKEELEKYGKHYLNYIEAKDQFLRECKRI